jgi:hypothetical protein
MISIERDSHGRTYQIWKQAQMNSCGVASAWMARGIARQMSINEDEWDLAIRIYQTAIGGVLGSLGISGGPQSLNPDAFANDQSSMASTFANFGMYSSQLASALRSEGLTVEYNGGDGTGQKIAHNKIAINKPAIVLIYWNGGGGHFVVVGRATQGAVSYLDPWDGRVNEQSNNGKYNARYGDKGIIGEILYISA